MASHPPFQVEDQTDEDFFDKLVNDDDDDFKVPSSSAPSFANGNELDEAKAFASASISEVETGVDDSGREGVIEAKREVTIDDAKTKVVDVQVEESSSLVSSNSFGVDSLVDTNNGYVGTDVTLDSTISKTGGSAGSGVKEVQWSAFNADSVQNDNNEFGSYDFFTAMGDDAANSIGKAGDNLNSEPKVSSGNEVQSSSYLENLNNYLQYQGGHSYGALTEQSADGLDLNNSQNWEDLYPGWKYDPNTGQWYQVDGYDATANLEGNADSNSTADWAVSDGKSEVSYLQQTVQSVAGAVAASGTTESVTNWSPVSQVTETNWYQFSQGNNEYPPHMVLDPQYPGWYYDTISQEWRSLDTYTSSIQSTVQAQDQLNQNGFASTGTAPHENDQQVYSDYGQFNNHGSEGFCSQGQDYNWTGSSGNYSQHYSNIWEPKNRAKSEATSDNSGKQQLENHCGPNFSLSNHASQQKSYHYGEAAPFYENTGQGRNDFVEIPGSRGFVPGGNYSQQFNQTSIEQNESKHISNDYYGDQNLVNLSYQPFQRGHQFSYAATAGTSSAGRPPHALVTFGFGGKLIVMKDGSLGNSSFGSQDPVGGSISVLNLMEVVTEKANVSSIGVGACDYFHTLCRQAFPGPLTGAGFGAKEFGKWIDERITHCESPDIDYGKGEVLRLLLSLLKIACQHYGKLRSPYGSDTTAKESDVPESAVARLFASSSKNGAQFSEYGALARCLQKMPSEGQMRATATEVQSLLTSGRKKEALHCAQEGQLWGPALVLAAQLGDQIYAETVKQMALRQLVAGSPLRTLCLLIAGQPAEVFSPDTMANSGIPGALSISQQGTQLGANGMLDDWEENLAVITANRTKDDELVLIHLGDCLWKERSNIIAAHICYIVAEANFEPYSDSARLCLIGADHWKFPRTYASPEAIQRTEVYEYSKVLGNSQYVLLPFQPYKLLYAYMLAEVGRVSDSLKYCQAVSKSLKTGRGPEVEAWRQLVSSLEERIRTHQQGGFSSLAPAKLVGKLLNLFDTTAHRVVGSLPPPVPTLSVGNVQGDEHHHQPTGPRVSTSQSTMAMSSLMPSASMEPISEWAADGNNRKTMHNRSVSEPDFGRTPRQDQIDTKETTSAVAPSKVQGTSRFGRFSFGSQLFQKTVGLVLRPRQDRQAKLGEKNRFYYDEKLKRWVEEGAESPAEEAALPPPPTTDALQNGTIDYNLTNVLKTEGSFSNGRPEFKSPSSSEHTSGIPPLPPTTNQFSARGRTGIRRYVDTFNQGGGNPTNLFHSPSVPSIKSVSSANPKFFVPTPVSSAEQPVDTTGDSKLESAAIHDDSSAYAMKDSSPSQFRAPSSLMTMHRFASDDNISKKGMSGNRSLPSLSRRTASWGGSPCDALSFPNSTEIKPLGEVLGMPPSSFMPSDPSLMHSSTNGGSFADDLHEVEL